MSTSEARTLPSWITPVVASVAALAVGITGFLIASPFAQPRVAELTTVEAQLLPTVSSVSHVGESSVDENGQLLPRTVAELAQTEPLDELRAAMREALAEADTEATGERPDAESSGDEPVDTSGITVLDPCPEAGSSDADCPTGTRSTVLKSIDLPALDLWFSANDPTAECPARTTATSIALRVATNVPARIALWYEVRGLTVQQELEFTDAERSEWASAAEAGEFTWLEHCVELVDLPDAWSGVVTIRAVADDGSVVTRAPRFTADSAFVTPPSWVRPIGRTAVMMSVPAIDTKTVQLRAIAVPFGQPTPSCDFGDGVAGALEPLEVFEERFTREELEARGYVTGFVKRFTAGFIVPEASTITLCAGTFAVSGRDGVLPESVFSEVYYSPDLVLPVVTVSEFAVGEGVRPTIELTARIGRTDGPVCGNWTTSRPVGDAAVICRYAAFDGDEGWDSALIVTAEGTGFDSTLTQNFVLPIAPQSCGLNCELPDTQYVDVPISSREPCIGSCPPSYLGTVRLQVDWEHGTRSWFGEWLREEAGAPDSDAPLLDTAQVPRLQPLVAGEPTQGASVRIATDVPTTMRLTVNRFVEFDLTEVVQEVVTTELVDDRTVELGPLTAGGEYYTLRVELTDADGNTSVYSPLPEAARAWANAVFRTDVPEVSTDVEVSITHPDGIPIAVGTTELLVGGGRWFERRDLVDSKWCTTGPVPFTDTTATVFARQGTGFLLTAGVTEAPDASDEPGACSVRGAQPVEEFTGTIPYDDLFTGATVTITNENGYVATLRLAPVD